MLTDEDISLMSPTQRRVLMRRLSASLTAVPVSQKVSIGPREVQVVVMFLSAVVLIPWIIYLALTLPHMYLAPDWNRAWVGFDLLLLMLIAATAVLGYLRRQLVMLTAFATGVMLVCDAWFDWNTSTWANRGWAAALAVFIELPLAALLITEAIGLLGRVAARLEVVDDGAHAWNVRIPPPPMS